MKERTASGFRLVTFGSVEIAIRAGHSRANANSNTALAINTATNTVVGSPIPVGSGPSAPSPKSLWFRRRSVGSFSRRERSAHIWIDTGRASNAEKRPTGRGPEGCVENGPAAALLVGYVSI
jgi:hypothetical protein